jgi:hypothetical protein
MQPSLAKFGFFRLLFVFKLMLEWSWNRTTETDQIFVESMYGNTVCGITMGLASEMVLREWDELDYCANYTD